MDTEIGASLYWLQHGECLVGFTDPGVDLLAKVASCSYLGAQLGEFYNVFYVHSSNHDLAVHPSVLSHNLGLHCVGLETKSVGCFAKTFRFLLGILMLAG